MTLPVRLVHTADLDPAALRAVRALLDTAFDGDFSDADFDHGLGGLHALLHDGAGPGGFVWIRSDQAAASGAVHRKAEDHPRTGRTRVVRQRGVGVPPAGGWGRAVPGVADPG